MIPEPPFLASDLKFAGSAFRAAFMAKTEAGTGVLTEPFQGTAPVQERVRLDFRKPGSIFAAPKLLTSFTALSDVGANSRD